MTINNIKFKTVKINCNRSLREAMNWPKTKSGSVLYTTVSDVDKVAERINLDNDYVDKAALSDPEYVANCQTYYNSPTNVKRIFICYNKVYIVYHIKPNSFYDRVHSVDNKVYDSDGKVIFKNVKDLSEKMLEFEQQQIAMVHNQYIPTGDEIKYTIEPLVQGQSNNLLKALSATYTFNNVEEVYFDWTALISREARDLVFPGDFSTDGDYINRYLSKSMQPCQVENNRLKNAIMLFNAGKGKDELAFMKKFPRLRVVAIVENLDKVSSSLESGEKDKLTWIQANAEYLKQNGGQIFYANFPGKLSECVDKSQMYLFDRNYHLQETLLADWKKFEQQNILKKVENVDTSTVEEAGELEQKLASVEEYLRVNHDKNWQAMFNSYLGITVTGIPRDKLTSILNEFTKDRRDRYKSILKLS